MLLPYAPEVYTEFYKEITLWPTNEGEQRGKVKKKR
jgi:hypothetical protein